MKKIAIIGSGSWGVALAIHLAKNGNKVKIWSFAQDEADLINNEKKCKLLPNVVIPENVKCTTSFKEALDGAELILHVTPSSSTDITSIFIKLVVLDTALLGKPPVVITISPLTRSVYSLADAILFVNTSSVELHTGKSVG